MALPSFLRPLPRTGSSKYPCLNAVFHHPTLGGDAHALWWPTLSGKPPNSILFFIPGNPGLVEFYLDFFTEIYRQIDTELFAIFAHAHLGHSANLPYTRCDLNVQVESAVEALRALSSSFPEADVIVVSHSMGSWISKQLLKSYPEKISGMILLTPTIRHIANTPNGRMLSWLFYPVPRTILANLAFLGKLLPTSVLKVVQRDWPQHQLEVLKNGLISSSGAIHACLVTSHDEMKMIQELDIELVNRHADILRIYFAGNDGWVGDHREYIVSQFKGPSEHIAFADDVPHAFCINHYAKVAEQCVKWIRELA